MIGASTLLCNSLPQGLLYLPSLRYIFFIMFCRHQRGIHPFYAGQLPVVMGIGMPSVSRRRGIPPDRHIQHGLFGTAPAQHCFIVQEHVHLLVRCRIANVPFVCHDSCNCHAFFGVSDTTSSAICPDEPLFDLQRPLWCLYYSFPSPMLRPLGSLKHPSVSLRRMISDAGCPANALDLIWKFYHREVRSFHT